MQIVIDHGMEFTSKALDRWDYENKMTLHFIMPDCPMENGYIESFHGKFCEEYLNEHSFLTLDDAKETIQSWRIDYNQCAPALCARGILYRLCRKILQLNSTRGLDSTGAEKSRSVK